MTRPIVSSLPLTPDGGMDGVMDPLNTSILSGLTLQPCLVAERAIVAVPRHQQRQALPEVAAGVLIGDLDGSGDQVILGLGSLPPRPADGRLPGRHLELDQLGSLPDVERNRGGIRRDIPCYPENRPERG